MRETLIFLTHFDNDDTERQVLTMRDVRLYLLFGLMI